MSVVGEDREATSHSDGRDRVADTGAAMNTQAENQTTSWCHPGQMLATMPRTIRSTRAAPSE